MSDDLNFQKLSTVQNNLMPTPVTLASALTIAPTTFVTFLTGATAIGTITPPVTGAHLLSLIATTTTVTTVTTGNIALATTLVLNKQLLISYDPTTAKYYPVY